MRHFVLSANNFPLTCLANLCIIIITNSTEKGDYYQKICDFAYCKQDDGGSFVAVY